MLWQPTRGILQPNQHWRRPAGGSNPLSLNPTLFGLPTVSTLYQTADISTPVTASGQDAGRLLNFGSGADWSQSTGANRPIYVASGGFEWLELAGAPEALLIEALASIRTIVMAVRTTGGLSDWTPTWLSPDTDTDGQLRRLSSDVPAVWDTSSGSHFGNSAFLVNGVAGNSLTLDADQVITAVAGSAKSTGHLGCAFGTGFRSPVGRFYFLFGHVDVLAAEVLAQVQAYAASRCPDLA
jgi:hypothetical protein